MKVLHHYTSIERWLLIANSGRIKTTESNLSMYFEHAGPDVVWLTTDSDCVAGHGISKTLDGTDKTQIRITVQLPVRDVHRWRDWVKRPGVDQDWIRCLVDAAEGGAGTWWVTQKPILFTRWVSVTDRATGNLLWTSPSVSRKYSQV